MSANRQRISAKLILLCRVQIVIIGNGISGITAARHIRKRDASCSIKVISSESKYFYSRTALMYIFMGHMKFEHTKPYEDSFWEKNRIELVQDKVTALNFEDKSLTCASESVFRYDKLIIATGSKPNKLICEGQGLIGVQALYSLQDLQLLERNSKAAKRAVVVGGGLIGVELAEMLHSRRIEVSMIVRENRFWGNVLPEEEAALIERHLSEIGVNLLVNTELDKIIADVHGRVCAVRTNDKRELPCELLGITVGVSPNIDFLKHTALETNRGVLVNEFLETNLPDVYAIGDCAEFREALPGRAKIEQVWYTGRMMGETLAASICAKRTAYKPGPWFNSAKFFDIEFQTYGEVKNELQEGASQFYWQSSSNKEALKIVYETESKKLLGVNVFGIRLRHDVMDSYLKKDVNLQYFLEHLEDVNFSAEFDNGWIKSVKDIYTQRFGKNVQSKRKSWFRILTPNA